MISRMTVGEVVAGSGDQMFAFVNHEAGGVELVQGIFDPASIQISLQGYGRNAIDRALGTLNRYPDPSNSLLRQRLSDRTIGRS